MITQDSLRFYKNHAVYPQFGGVVLDREEGRRIAEHLGDVSTPMGLVLPDRLTSIPFTSGQSNHLAGKRTTDVLLRDCLRPVLTRLLSFYRTMDFLL